VDARIGVHWGGELPYLKSECGVFKGFLHLSAGKKAQVTSVLARTAFTELEKHLSSLAIWGKL